MDRLDAIMNTTSRILGEARRPPTEMELNNPQQAYKYARYVLGGRFPEGEAAIAKHSHLAYEYARYVVKGPFPEGEAAIAKNIFCAYVYATDVLKGRFPEGEEVIATNTRYYYKKYTKKYLEAFPDAKIEWYAREWIDWTQL